MKKTSFIVGAVLTVLSAACCIFGGILVIDTIDAIKANTGEALGAIITIPISFIAFGLQTVLGLIAIGLFIGCVKSELRGIKIAAIVCLVICAALILLSVALIIALTNASASNAANLLSVILRA